MIAAACVDPRMPSDIRYALCFLPISLWNFIWNLNIRYSDFGKMFKMKSSPSLLTYLPKIKVWIGGVWMLVQSIGLLNSINPWCSCKWYWTPKCILCASLVYTCIDALGSIPAILKIFSFDSATPNWIQMGGNICCFCDIDAAAETENRMYRKQKYVTLSGLSQKPQQDCGSRTHFK